MPLLKVLSSLVLACLILTACKSTMDHANRISEGMTKPELISALGPPVSTMSPGPGIEVLHYTFKKQRLYRVAVPLTKDYLVRLVNGKVEAYGTPKELSASHLDPRERTVNLNIKTDAPTAPGQPLIQP